MDPFGIITSIGNFLAPLLGMLDITNGLTFGAAIAIFLLVMLGEANLAVPLLIESVWLIIGYQAGTSLTALLVALSLFLIAQAGRQAGMLTVYGVLPTINKPLSRLYMKPLRGTRLYKKVASNDYVSNARFLSLVPATLGMLTPLNGPIKIMLILKRRPRVLLLGTLFSGMMFDTLYILLGALVKTTSMNLAFLPLFLLAGFLVLVVFKVRTRHALQ